MPPSKLQKTVRPVLRKLKKWPFKDTTPVADEKPAYKSVRDIFPDADTDDTSIESDVTVIEIAATPIPAARAVRELVEQPPVRPARTKHADNKLKTAIDTFDRILDEYSAPPTKKEKPKLQKAKTCSIIESKCILKKHVTRQDNAFKSLDESSLGIRASSLYNLDAELVDLSPFVVKTKAIKGAGVRTGGALNTSTSRCQNDLSSADCIQKEHNGVQANCKRMENCDIVDGGACKIEDFDSKLGIHVVAVASKLVTRDIEVDNGAEPPSPVEVGANCVEKSLEVVKSKDLEVFEDEYHRPMDFQNLELLVTTKNLPQIDHGLSSEELAISLATCTITKTGNTSKIELDTRSAEIGQNQLSSIELEELSDLKCRKSESSGRTTSRLDDFQKVQHGETFRKSDMASTNVITNGSNKSKSESQPVSSKATAIHIKQNSDLNESKVTDDSIMRRSCLGLIGKQRNFDEDADKSEPTNIEVVRDKSNDSITRRHGLKPINKLSEKLEASSNTAIDSNDSIIRRNCFKPIDKLTNIAQSCERPQANNASTNIAVIRGKSNESINRSNSLKPTKLFGDPNYQGEEKVEASSNIAIDRDGSKDTIIKKNCFKPIDTSSYIAQPGDRSKISQSSSNVAVIRGKSNDSITRRNGLKPINKQQLDNNLEKPINNPKSNDSIIRRNCFKPIDKPSNFDHAANSSSNKSNDLAMRRNSFKQSNPNLTQKILEASSKNNDTFTKRKQNIQDQTSDQLKPIKRNTLKPPIKQTQPITNNVQRSLKPCGMNEETSSRINLDSSKSEFDFIKGTNLQKSTPKHKPLNTNNIQKSFKPSTTRLDLSKPTKSTSISTKSNYDFKNDYNLQPPTLTHQASKSFSHKSVKNCSTTSLNADYHFTNNTIVHTSTPKPKLQKTLSDSKVKTAINRLNNLSTPDQQDRSIEIVVETAPKLQKPSSIPRASSCVDVRTIPKRPPISRIPIKSFPSTPSGLNLDRNLSAASPKKPSHARSMLNLKIERRVAPTFGEAKGEFETKFAEKPSKKPSAVFKAAVRRTDTYTKPRKETNNLEEATKVSPDDKKRIFNASKSDSGIVLNEFGKDYSSDDNSDDSGNISNGADDLKVYSSAESLAEGSKCLEENKNQIFFRSGVLSDLEAQRDERLAGMVVNLQAHCRGYLARRRLAHRKLQDLAVRCLQRNVRKFMLVRDWPWWRLLVRVTPLLNVHRTEEELRQKSEELELLRTKLERVESDRTTLKHENDKLEAKLSEMTADYAEEHSTSTLATERLDAETSERVRLERELSETQHKNKQLQQASERLEMELLYARSDLNGISEEDEDADGDSVYKQRYERAVRELEFTKRRLQQQHEDDLEQLVGLKKQLEKKLTDAYEEVEEQRQVVGQWKRKVQKVNGEMNDLKLLLEEQSARNNLLEKKQRKFDSETQLLQDELRQEKQAKERLGREKEVSIAEKFTLESNLADVRLELEMKEEKFTALQRELDEVTYGGKTEEEVALLRKQKIECERRLHDQEEELDELAGQVQLLEQAKLKLEMNLEQMRKSSKKEAQQHDEELEEVRCSAQKKVKALEAQLENEHEERTILLREKHEIERRLVAALESDRNEKACDEAVLQRLKRDLKRTKALLRDTQAQLERQKAENPGKALIRQLRNQLEDVECARTLAVKAKQSLDAELSETQALLEDAQKMKNEAEDRLNSVSRERSDMVTQLEENEEELAEVLKKYKQAVSQMGLDQLALQEQVSLVSELEIERNGLKEQLAELTTKLESVESMGDASSHLLVKRTELKVKELESKLDLEQTTKSRLEVQIARLKEAVDKLQSDVATARGKEQVAQDQIRKLQRNLRELRDEHNNAMTKEGEALLKRKELEKRCEGLESETATARTDLRLALKRIEDLQSAIQGELDDDSIDNSDSDHDSYSSDDSVSTFLANHKITSKPERTADGMRRLSTASRSSTSSNIGKDASYA